jgi:hypothetical protein
MDNLVYKKHPLDVALEESLKGNLGKSLEILESLSKDDPRVIFNIGWHKIRNGDLLGGFENLNAGRFINCFGLPAINGKIWRGEDLTNKTLLFRCEGGFGDQILNFRFANEFKEMGARVVISCDPKIADLFSNNGYVCVSNSVVENVYYDYWVPAMSAPWVLNHTYETLSNKSYLTSGKRNLYSKKNTLKVGIKWSGNPEFEHEQHRRFDPSHMIDLSEIQGITLFSLQRDENLVDGLPFPDMRNEMKTWQDTADIVNSLDLVITSCTSIAHLAGALGIETWVVVPILPYYTWSVPGDRSPWYESVKIFRQEKYGDWSAPFENIKNELIKKIGGI